MGVVYRAPAFGDYPKAIELGHDTWDHPSVLAGLTEHQTAWVNIDELCLGASLHGTECNSATTTSPPSWAQ